MPNPKNGGQLCDESLLWWRSCSRCLSMPLKSLWNFLTHWRVKYLEHECHHNENRDGVWGPKWPVLARACTIRQDIWCILRLKTSDDILRWERGDPWTERGAVGQGNSDQYESLRMCIKVGFCRPCCGPPVPETHPTHSTRILLHAPAQKSPILALQFWQETSCR